MDIRSSLAQPSLPPNLRRIKNCRSVALSRKIFVPLASPRSASRARPLVALATAGTQEGTPARKNRSKEPKKNDVFLWFFARLLDKLFTFGKENKFSFRLLNQNFRTFARKNQNIDDYGNSIEETYPGDADGALHGADARHGHD